MDSPVKLAIQCLLFGACCLLPMSSRAADSWRVFTDTSGRHMVAKILRVETEQVTFELKSNGQHVTLAMDKLCAGDALYVLQYHEPTEADRASAAAAAAASAASSAAAASELYPRSRKEIEAGIKEIAKRPRPKELSAEVHEATKQLNIYRFLCGVPFAVVGDVECSKNAGSAAIACREAGTISHSLGHFTDHCNLSTMGNMAATVAQYMEDGGDNNREARGHRAWCLNPPMGKVGFGSGGKSFSAMWCMDNSGTAQKGTWAYPGKGFFPLQYFHGNAWSFYGLDCGANPKVEIFRLAKRPEQPLPATGDIPGHEVKVRHVSHAMMNGLNFEPAEPAKHGIYWVRISSESIHEGYLVELF